MKRHLLLFLLTTMSLLFLSRPVLGEKMPEAKKDSPQIIEAKKLDNKANILSKYLASYNSPMQYHAQDFVDAAEAYNLDWKLLPSIAGVESTFGKFIPGGFNAWGWGVYGTQAIYFSSWRDGMFTVAKGLRENYLNKGLTDPYAINRIYAASPRWGGNVSYFMADLEKFANNFESNEQNITQVGQAPSIAAVSGQLALR
ncbi:MAG: hypothetical protein Q7R77_00010 [Candidatus Daviesbacteria bacterium]|nr:hypothetical protein [Candidatus Daviesbacteria bacterium]